MWFPIASWHYEIMVSRASMPKARCGRWGRIGAERRDAIPLGEKTCESCLRLLAADQSRKPGEE